MRSTPRATPSSSWSTCCSRPTRTPLAGENTLRSIYDPTAGSGGMLLVAQDALKELNPDIKVTVYGQELM
ncbi:N-6 DNA methylase, partial [Agrobacterium sp. S2]|nr:N-6 DNA methylase [Agrobacterium sp. S2]